MKELTRNQCNQLAQYKSNWAEKAAVVEKLAVSFGVVISNREDLCTLMTDHLPKCMQVIEQDHKHKVKTGVLRTNQTPTDVKGTFAKVCTTIIGQRYHVSWAYSGAVFVLKRIDGQFAYLDNPKRPRKELLRCLVSELRELRSRS